MNNKLKLVLFEKLNTLELLKGITLLEYICMMAPQNTWHQTLPLGVCVSAFSPVSNTGGWGHVPHLVPQTEQCSDPD